MCFGSACVFDDFKSELLSFLMTDDNILTTPTPVSPVKMTWYENRLKMNDTAYYVAQRGKFEESFKGNEFLTIPEALKAVNTRIISLLTSNIKTRKLIGVSRENMEDALKTLHIIPKVLARKTNALWDILLPTEQQARDLAGSVLNTKTLRLQTEYIGTSRTKITIHGYL